MTISIDQDLCCGCSCCMDACDQAALTMQEKRDGARHETAAVAEDDCIDCDDCVEMCANGALRPSDVEAS
jgi:NAD-dependent dihydropyrimidine dehydrogenase PreA subunit